VSIEERERRNDNQDFKVLLGGFRVFHNSLEHVDMYSKRRIDRTPNIRVWLGILQQRRAGAQTSLPIADTLEKGGWRNV
jgi:hypothetical protein